MKLHRLFLLRFFLICIARSIAKMVRNGPCSVQIRIQKDIGNSKYFHMQALYGSSIIVMQL